MSSTQGLIIGAALVAGLWAAFGFAHVINDSDCTNKCMAAGHFRGEHEGTLCVCEDVTMLKASGR